jgi:hypothetical protein
MNHKVVPLVAAFVEADAPLREADEIVLGFFELERIHIKLLVDVAGVEQEGVGRDAEQRLVSSAMPGMAKSSRFWLARMTLDSFLRTRFMKLRMYSIAVRFVRNRYSSSMLAAVLPSVSSLSDMKDSTLNSRAFFTFLLACRSPFTPNTTKAAGCHIGMTVEKLALRTLTHGVEPQQDVLKQFRCVELKLLRVVGFVFPLDQLIEIGEDWIVLRRQL